MPTIFVWHTLLRWKSVKKFIHTQMNGWLQHCNRLRRHLARVSPSCNPALSSFVALSFSRTRSWRHALQAGSDGRERLHEYRERKRSVVRKEKGEMGEGGSKRKMRRALYRVSKVSLVSDIKIINWRIIIYLSIIKFEEMKNLVLIKSKDHNHKLKVDLNSCKTGSYLLFNIKQIWYSKHLSNIVEN